MRRGVAALCALLCVAGASFGQVEGGDAAPDPLVLQRRLALVLRQVSQLYEAGDYRGAIRRLDDLQGGAAQDLSARNLRGAILTKLGDYNQAQQVFQAILSADPSYFPAAFNMAEVQYMQGDYASAMAAFTELRNRDPRNELVRFKVFLCHLLLGQTDEARGIAAGFIPAGSTPAWYYAQAMIAKKNGDGRAADKHIKAAREIYGSGGCKLFDESLVFARF